MESVLCDLALSISSLAYLHFHSYDMLVYSQNVINHGFLYSFRFITIFIPFTTSALMSFTDQGSYKIYSIQSKIHACLLKRYETTCFQILIIYCVAFVAYLDYFFFFLYVIIYHVLQRLEGVGTHCKLIPGRIK